MSLTEHQLVERRNWLGGTDAAALAGVNPPRWSQPIDVWLEKRPDLAGESMAPKRTNALMGMGHLLEPVVAQLFSAATGYELRRRAAPVRSRRYPWMGGHLDRTMGGAIFEAKYAQADRGWGPTMWAGREVGWLPITPVIPPHYSVQIQHYLIVTEKPVAFVGLALGYAEFRAYRVPADYELHEQLIELERRFWHDNVLAGVPPEPDGSEAYSRMIAARLAQDRGTEVIATPEQGAWMRDLRAAQLAKKAAEQAERLAKQRLQLSLERSGASSLLGGGFSATYRTHEVRDIQWQAVAQDLAARLSRGRHAGAVDALVARTAHQHVKVSTQRPFRPKWDDDEQEVSSAD